jgi:tripartite-type tricarboxylate transporter receptor subunit TctC
MKRREFMTLLAGAAAASSVSWMSWPLAARAQQPSGSAVGFPNKTLRIIVPFTPGGSNDVVAREIAAGLQASLNQTAVVENKPGGGGNIAYSYVAKSPPDGHVMLIAPASFTMGPHLSRNPVYNPVTDFAPINLVADVPFVMVVPASLPVRTVQEFIALARSSPNRLSFGSVGVGTPQHLGGELFKMRAGVDLVHVPFRGATAVLPDLLAGRIDMFIGAVNSLLPLIRDGSLRALAATSLVRIASLPDVPTLSEAAFPGFEVGSGVGLVAPAATPSDIIETLNREIGAIIATPGFHQRMALIGVDVVGTTRPMRSSSATTTPNGARWLRRPGSSRSEPVIRAGVENPEHRDAGPPPTVIETKHFPPIVRPDHEGR